MLVYIAFRSSLYNWRDAYSNLAETERQKCNIIVETKRPYRVFKTSRWDVCAEPDVIYANGSRGRLRLDGTFVLKLM